MPSSLGNLSNLNDLYLNDNQLSCLPEELGSLTQLRVLRLNNNRLEALPTSIGNLTRLERLHVARNQLRCLPKSIVALTRLLELGLGHNLLASLPHGMGDMTALSKLVLANNRIERLPGSIGSLVQLRKLNVAHNRLTTLPHGVGCLVSLRELLVDGNQLADVPWELIKVPDRKRARVITAFFAKIAAEQYWERTNHVALGKVCNLCLFTTVLCANRLTRHQRAKAKARAGRAANLGSALTGVPDMPPEMWDVIFRFLRGTSFPQVSAARTTKTRSIKARLKRMSRSASNIRPWSNSWK